MSAYGDDFGPDVHGAERDGLEQLAHRLVAERPVPRPAFRGELGRRLIASSTTPREFRLRAIACLASGAALLLAAAFGVTGSGPLAPTPTAAQVAQIVAR